MSRVREESTGGSKKKRVKPSGGGFWKGFIEVTLNTAHKEALSQLDLDMEYPYSFIDELLLGGYKVSFAYSDSESTYRVTMVDVSESSAMCGYALAGRGSTLRKAFASLVYKHVTVLDGLWGQAKDAGSVEEYG